MKTNPIPCNSSRHAQQLKPLKSIPILAALAAIIAMIGLPVQAQCPVVELASGLSRPVAIAQSSQGNLLISDTTSRVPNTGRISIVDLDGHRRTLLSGLPSGIADVGDPLGVTGLFLRGRTLFVLISVGDVAIGGPIPGSALPNPNPVSSPLFSSVLAVHFSAGVEKNTEGLTLTLADQEALASGQKVTLSNGNGDAVVLELIADFLNYIPFPLPTVPDNVQLSNPFDLVAVEDQLYVTDGGRNLVWQVDIPTGAISVLAQFPNIPNPLFPAVGGPTSQAVPTGIRAVNGQLLVTLFRGAPFAPGTSVVEQIDPLTGDHAPFITGLKTAIDVLPLTVGDQTDYLVLQNASVGPFFGGPGLLLRFPASGGAPSVVANCLDRPTSMTLDEKTGTVYVTELNTGRVVAVALEP
jgi:hypothetical protein